MGDTATANPGATPRAGAPGPAAAAREFDLLELLAAAYLLLPLFVFLLGWLRWPFALPLSLALLPALYRAWQGRQLRAVRLSRRELLAVAAVTAAWVCLSGLAPAFFLNLDWMTRMSVLRDLVVGSWPLGYDTAAGEMILRCPPGYYMVPALAGKLSSLHGARLALWGWTALGTALFLGLVVSANPARKPGAWRSALLIAVFFSGMDILGWLISSHSSLQFGAHIEWWATQFINGSQIQYSSQTTQLFWVPNHGLPGWLLAAVAWRHRQHGLSVLAAALLLLGTVFWAPLVALGAAPLLLWCAWRGQGWRQLLQQSLRLPVLALLPAGWLVCRYLTMGAVPAGAAAGGDLTMQVYSAIIFSAFEWGLLAWAVAARGERAALLLLALLQLLLLPFVHFGPSNDLVMRASIPALVILMMATIEAWQTAQPLRRSAITVLLAIGSVTPLLEFERAFQSGPRYLHEQANFTDVTGESVVWHYLSPVTRPDVKAMLKPARPVPGAAQQP
ncbi:MULTISPECIES: hypothetical protein [unclassified Duganella]|uniref:hypothetical protein n=1 Tax=unclassified Duganella TaxID=2636909 RepID=UPI0006FBFF1C|nr:MULTISPECIES: hypothetical protein [unclassified Duganella]KQV47497.1 hypothetical protein ASD07_11175 [Duganella sp. Root336D2]KRC00087.1 hypothetical protein ASE26_23960 [Duganella sp. Root198D2]